MDGYSVYMHTTPSKKRYIGITKNDPKKRWCGGSGYYYNVEFHKEIKKCGWDKIKHEVLYTSLTKEEAEQKEIELIAKYDTTNPKKGFNYTKGGNHQGMVSDATRRLLSEKSRKVPCVCVETGQVFDSMIEAAQFVGIHPSSISNSCVTNGRSSSKGYHFVYADEKTRECLDKRQQYVRWW